MLLVAGSLLACHKLCLQGLQLPLFPNLQQLRRQALNFLQAKQQGGRLRQQTISTPKTHFKETRKHAAHSTVAYAGTMCGTQNPYVAVADASDCARIRHRRCSVILYDKQQAAWLQVLPGHYTTPTP